MAESKGRKFNYEAMFLVSQSAEPSMGKAIEHIKHLFERANAEIIALSKWDERRLAFENDKQKRGLYVLAYFTADPVNIQGLERDCNLSETLMRAMFLRADHDHDQAEQATDGRTGNGGQRLAAQRSRPVGRPFTGFDKSSATSLFDRLTQFDRAAQ